MNRGRKLLHSERRLH